MYSYMKLIVFSITFLVFITTTSSSAEDQRIQCNNPNEHYDCGSACQTTCDNIGEPCPFINKKCNDACYCDKGYARNKNAVCILIEHCPKVGKPQKCNENEHFECCNTGQTECDKLGVISTLKTKECACHCNKGYARDYNKRCVSIRECPQMPKLICNKPHEHYECGSACQTTCRNYGQNCTIINIKCNEACYCNEYYARDDNGRCIPVWQCPDFNGPKKCCNPNEHYERGQVCEKNCATLGKPCNKLSPIDGCYCNEGYARNVHGVCILIEDCPKICNCPEQNSSDCSKSDSSPEGCGCH